MSDFVAKAAAVARETGWDIENTRENMEWGSVGIGPVGKHRDSEALSKSNFKVVYNDLHRQFPESVDTVSFGHWAVGWVEEIIFDASKPEVVKAVSEWVAALADYPVADDMDYSETEWNDNHPSENECYADDREDCSCGVAEREHAEREAEETEGE